MSAEHCLFGLVTHFPAMTPDVPVAPTPPFASFPSRWLKEFDWLVGKNHTDGSNRPYCRTCKTFVSKKAAPATVNRTTLLRHEQSISHKGPSISESEAPSMQEFLDCLENREAKRSFRSSKLGRTKEWKLSWCLAEAYKAAVQKKLSRAQSSTICQDAQGQLLSVRFFSARDGDREASVSGLLALIKDWGAGAEQLSTSVGKACKRFFFQFWNPPIGWRGSKPVLRRAAYVQFKKTVMFIASDAASDETKAIRILAGKSSSSCKACGLFPSVKARVRDNVHAAGRFTLKWHWNIKLKETYTKYVRGKGSITSLIWHSEDNKRIFNKHALQY
jgi:hypothetical protein